MPIRISGSTGISGLDGSAAAPVYAGANTNIGLFVSGNTVNVSATSLAVGNTVVSNSGVSVGGIAVSQYSGMMKNRIINGDFRIDQRFNGAANNNIAAPQYQVDRWYHQGIVAGKLRFQQNNTNGPGSSATQLVTGFSNYFGANVVSSNTVNSSDYWFMVQPIEGLNVADLNWGTPSASPVTLSFWSYSSIAGTHSGSILSSNVARSYPFSYTINTANTWQYQTITIPGDTSSTANWYSNNNIGMYVIYSLGVGSTQSGTTGSWASYNYWATTGAVQVVNNSNGSFYLTGVQLEKGSQATAWDWRHYTTELQLCQRYLAYFGNYDQEYIGTAFLYSTGTTGTSQTLFFPVRMRTKPTGLVTSGASNFAVSDGDSGTSFTALNLQSSSPSSMTLSFTLGASRTTFRPHTIYASALGQYFYVSAELGIQN